ncbi:MAG: hypothetical protein IT287_00045 [Bdellovibrionaceae bacterium]|nr:hypothetical protein [Pseudobdellovibrionaceae bacterium]
MVRQYEAETEMVSAMLGIKAALSTAVQVNYCGATGTADDYTTRGAANAADITLGCIYSGNFQNGTTGAANLIALVVKDMNVDGNTSALSASAIYYQRPTTANSGALYIDQEVNSGGWVRLSPVNAPFMFTRFVEFQVLNVKAVETAAGTAGNIITAVAADAGKTAVSAEFRLMMRYFTKGKVNEFNWEPAVNLTAAERNAMAQHYDIEKRMKVTFSNNSFDRSRYLAPRPFGNVHLFKFAAGVSR